MPYNVIIPLILVTICHCANITIFLTILPFFYLKTTTNNLRIYTEPQKTMTIQSNLDKEEQSWRYHTTWFQTIYYRAVIIKTAWCWCKNSFTAQTEWIETSEINSCLYGQLIYNGGEKNMQWRNYSLFNKCGWENWTDTYSSLFYTDMFLSSNIF